MDIAHLGLAVDSSQAEKGALALNRLSTAAKRAEVASAKQAYAQASAALAAARASDTATKADVANALAAKRRAMASLEAARAAQAKSVADHAQAAAANAAAAAMKNEAASATQAAAAMRTHASAVNDNTRRMGGSMSGLAAQFQDIGVTAAMGMNPAIIALQQGTQIAGQMEAAMQGGASATSVLGTAFKSLFAPLTFITIALTALAAAGLQMVDWPSAAAAALNGLASTLQAVAPYAVAAAAALALLYAPAIIGGVVSLIALLGRLAVAAGIAAASMAAANPAIALVVGITAAVAAANIFRDELAQIFGRDIVADAKNAVNFIIGAFVGGFDAVKATWSMLPAALGDLVISTANTVIGGVESMVNKVAGLIDGFIGKINSAMKSLPFGIGDSINIGTIGSFSLPRIANPNAGAAGAAMDAAKGAFSGAMGTDYVGGMTDAIARGASAASAKLKELAGSFTGAGAAAEGAGGKAKGAADKAADAWAGLRKVTDDVTEKMRSAASSLGQSFGGIFKGLLDRTMSWKDAAINAITSVIKYLNDMNLAGGGKGIFGGGFLQGLIGGLFGIGFAKGGYTGNGAANAAAGVVHGREYVFNARATAKIGKGNLDAMHRAANGYQHGGYVTPVMPRIQAPANSSQLVVIVRAEEGEMFRPTVEVIADNRAVKVVDSRAPSIAAQKSQQTVTQYDDAQRRGGFGAMNRSYSSLRG